MKKGVVALAALLTACAAKVGPDQYVANMYAKGSLKGYEDTGASSATCTKSCPGCHVKNFDRAKIVVDEVLAKNSSMSRKKVVDGCKVSISDSLGLMNVSESRYIPAGDGYGCDVVFEKEKSYLKAMGFAE